MSSMMRDEASVVVLFITLTAPFLKRRALPKKIIVLDRIDYEIKVEAYVVNMAAKESGGQDQREA